MAETRVTHQPFFPEVDAHRGGELAVELVVGVPVQEGGLAHPGVAECQQLDEIVIVPLGHGAAQPAMWKKKRVGLKWA